MDVDRRLGENRALRQRLEVLLAEGRRNEQIFSRHRRIELKRVNGYDAVTLALCDPDHELRRLPQALEIDVDDHSGLNLASHDCARFVAGMGTDFLDRLAGIIAICFENAANHERLKHLSLSDALGRYGGEESAAVLSDGNAAMAAHLVAAADRGLYQAKADGRNCVRAVD
jgi:GGDEF domain-containing protein